MALTLKKSGGIPALVSELFEKDGFFSDWSDWQNRVLRKWDAIPSANVIENGDEFRIEVAVPGLEKDDFKIETDGELLTISAEKQQESKEEKEEYCRREFSYNSFNRSFQLPENVLADKIDAKYDDGILRLSIPKKVPSNAKPKKEVKVS